MEGSVGTALRDARLKQNLTVEEVARATKIRPDRIVDLESDDYMRFPNLAYARSFLVLYAKYLHVDITRYPTVDVVSAVGLGDYQYLQSDEKQKKHPRARQEPEGPPEKPRWLIAFFVLLVMAALGALVGWGIMNYLRLGPVENLLKKETAAHESPTPLPAPSPSATPAQEKTPPPSPSQQNSPADLAPWASGSAATLMSPGAVFDEVTGVVPAAPMASPSPEAEVRKAEPVAPTVSDEAVLAQPAVPVVAVPPATPSDALPPQGAVREITLRATKKTKVRIVRDDPKSPSLYFGFVNPAMRPLTFKGSHFWINATDPDAVKVTIDGKPVTGPESGVEIQESH